MASKVVVSSKKALKGKSEGGSKNAELANEQQQAVDDEKDEQGTDKKVYNWPTEVIHSTKDKTKEFILREKGYEMKQKLGAGAFATVYKAIKNNQVSACKVIDTKEKKGHRYKDLKSELYVLQKVQHPNLIKLYEHFMIDETVYLFIEFAAGGTVSDHVRKTGPLSEAESKRLFRQMCGAVHHMHMKGISHRDLKLGNILLNEKGDCKVTDFGLSRLSYKRDKGVIYCNKYSGTEPYMAPEILCIKFKTAEEAKKWYYDPLPADIWALGICLYAMVSKAYPFNPEDKDLMLNNQMNRKWKFVRRVRNKLSEEVKDLTRHLLNPEVMPRVTFHCINAHPWLHTNAGEDNTPK